MGAKSAPSPRGSLHAHWPEYLIEAWALCMFMMSAGVFATLFGSPDSPALQALPDELVRRVLGGVAMGLTAIALIYSPWGQRSGAHMNPAVTLTFLRLGKVARSDAVFYILAQFVGGILGVLLVWALFGASFADPPVGFAVTVPGPHGVQAALVAEFLISFGMMLTILIVSNHTRLQRLTGLCAGVLVALYITFESPLSGMSMNPARTFASAAPGGNFTSLWLYFVAPILGMLAASGVYQLAPAGTGVHCAKLDHSPRQRCIHCGYVP